MGLRRSQTRGSNGIEWIVCVCEYIVPNVWLFGFDLDVITNTGPRKEVLEACHEGEKG